MPPMPRPATSAVTLTPRLSRMTIIAMANTATLTSTRMMRHRIAERRAAGSSPTRLRITPRMISRAQIATCSAAAMMKNMSARRASLVGGSA